MALPHQDSATMLWEGCRNHATVTLGNDYRGGAGRARLLARGAALANSRASQTHEWSSRASWVARGGRFARSGRFPRGGWGPDGLRTGRRKQAHSCA